MERVYKKPPIVEAVIEFVFASELKPEVLEKVRQKFLETYPLSTPTMRMDVEVNDQGAKIQRSLQAHRMTTKEAVDTAVLGASSLALIREPPYCGWEAFIERTRIDFRLLQKLGGVREISRIGVRFVNRIDIPIAPGQPLFFPQYIGIYPSLPDIGGEPLNSYLINFDQPLGKDGCKVILNSGTASSPLINHASLMLDIDVIKEGGIPRQDDAVWALLDRIRSYKNLIFEKCITPDSRALFNR